MNTLIFAVDFITAVNEPRNLRLWAIRGVFMKYVFSVLAVLTTGLLLVSCAGGGGGGGNGSPSTSPGPSGGSNTTDGTGATGTNGGGGVLASTTGTLSGTIVDADSLAWGSPTPLSGVTVTVAGKTMQTGADGVYTFTGVTAGNVTIAATRSEYTAGSLPTTVVADQTTTQDVYLVFTRAVRTVTGKNGVGAAEAEFTLKAPGELDFRAPSVFANHEAWLAPVRGAWIGPANGNEDGVAGIYKYEYHFQLTEASAATMRGAWDSDNGTIAYLNGHKIVDMAKERATPFTELNAVNVTDSSYFVVGDNVLAFEVDNWAPGPTGFYFVALIKY